ncbi:hypothetical protein [Gilliamella sp. Choc6-1]|nr:hypothetical protein [Gilliamella apicola]
MAPVSGERPIKSPPNPPSPQLNPLFSTAFLLLLTAALTSLILPPALAYE